MAGHKASNRTLDSRFRMPLPACRLGGLKAPRYHRAEELAARPPERRSLLRAGVSRSARALGRDP